MCPGIESEESQEATANIFGSPFQRLVGKSVEFWDITTIARNRIDSNDVPPHLTVNERAVLHELYVRGAHEVDELADMLNLSIPTTEIILQRLQGYGYVVQTVAPQQKV
jgi:DNA-binding MarR family transcriptional regulator